MTNPRPSHSQGSSASRRAPGEVFARIVEEDGPSHVGIVLDRVSLEPSSRALVEFSREDSPLLAVGDTVYISFVGSRGAEPAEELDSVASVVFRGEGERYRRYEFTFGGPQDDMKRLFERRDDERIDSPDIVRVEVRGRGGHERFETNVRDLSSTGIGICTSLDQERGLLDTEEVQLAIYLDPEGSPLEVVGRLVYRRLTPAGVHCGIEFLEAPTPGFAAKQARIQERLRAA